MVDRLGGLGGSYLRMNDDGKKFSYLMDESTEISRETNQLLDQISTNMSLMKGKRDQYRKDTTARTQKDTFEQFKELEVENRIKINKVRQNIQQLFSLAKKSPKDSQQFKFRQKEASKHLQRMRTVVHQQIEQDRAINKNVEEKQSLLQKTIPQQFKGLNLRDLTTGPYSADVRNAAQDLMDKIEEVHVLAKSIEQCVELMKYIQQLVHIQGLKIEEATDNVRQANKYLEMGDKNLQAAVEEQKSGMRKKCIIIVVAIVLIAAILVVIFGLDILKK